MATIVQSPTNATITVSPAKRTRAPRTKRAPAPTAKVRENQAIKRTRRATRTETPPPLHFRNVDDSDTDYEDEDRDSSHTLEELLVLVKGLKNTTDQQNHAILDAQTGSKELKEAHQIVKAQNTELQDEVQVNKAQRAWQERCASHGRTDPTAMQMFTEMQSKRRKWTRIIEKAKVSHWREGLPGPSILANGMEGKPVFGAAEQLCLYSGPQGRGQRICRQRRKSTSTYGMLLSHHPTTESRDDRGTERDSVGAHH